VKQWRNNIGWQILCVIERKFLEEVKIAIPYLKIHNSRRKI